VRPRTGLVAATRDDHWELQRFLVQAVWEARHPIAEQIEP
jgi:hypothetical protein